MDEYIMETFMTALKISLSDKDLPIEVSVFKEKHFNKCVPEGVTIDWKNSSYKKIGKFL